ncbi:MAG: ABC transporter permease [Candidatus Bathyarchaeia archaeon]
MTRSVTMVGVLLAIVLITLAVMGPALDDILRGIVTQEVKNSILGDPKVVSRFGSTAELQAYVQSQVELSLESLGLYEPWYSPTRLWSSVGRLLSLDLGSSYYMRSAMGSMLVKDIIMEALPRTILLFTTATVLNSIIGLLLGLKAARKAGSTLDRLTSTLGVASNSFPLWWVGMLMIIAFAYAIPVLPARATPLVPASDPTYPLLLLYHMTLPLATLVMLGFGGWTYVVRNLVIGVLQEDYVSVAMAKGLPERRVLYGHVLKSAAPPVVTIIALSLSGSLGGAIITEAVFDWPGLGRLYWNAVTSLDIPVILGLTYITTLIFLITVFIADILYGYFDPRVKVG